MKRPKYTKSRDGTPRCTIKVEYRLTKEQYELLKRYAEAEHYEDVADVFHSEGGLAIEALLFEIVEKGKH